MKTKDANTEKFSWQNVFDMYISGGEEETGVIKSKNNRILVEDFSSSLQTKAWQSVLDGKIDCFILKRMRDNMHNVEE